MTMSPLEAVQGYVTPFGVAPVPYGAVPQPYAGGQVMPMGVVGDFLGGAAPAIGGWLGGLFGNQQLGQQIGQVASPLARLIPFGVDPLAAANGAAPTQPGAQQGIIWAQNTLDPEAQAAQDFLQAATSSALRRLFDFVNTNKAQFPQLSGVDPLIKRAAELFGNRDYSHAFVQAYQAYRYITMVRGRSPNLPAL